MKRHGKTSNVRRGLLFLAVTLSLLAIITAAAMLWERQLYAPEESTVSAAIPTAEMDPVTIPETQPTQPTEATVPTLEAGGLDGKQVLNILITGQDRRDADAWGRSDTMILCSIDAERDRVIMVSFLRDLYLEIPGYGTNRLNDAYSWCGAELLN